MTDLEDTIRTNMDKVALETIRRIAELAREHGGFISVVQLEKFELNVARKLRNRN